MAKWKLSRQIFGCEEFTLSPGDNVTVGRGNNNNITLSSAAISRNHCVINVQNNKALITDLQSSNGVYVGTNKIPPNTPYVIEESDVIGLGWTLGAPLVNIKDSEKYVFKLIKDKQVSPIISRITFQDDNELNKIEAEIAKFDSECNEKAAVSSPLLCSKPPMKRKLNDNIKLEIKQEINTRNENENYIINISDSDCDVHTKVPDDGAKKAKLQPINEETKNQLTRVTEIKNENDLIEYDAFNVKQKYLGYDDEPIYVSDSESEQWFLRLSQNSPGKPFIKMVKTIKEEIKQEDGSHSQIDDDFIGSHLVFEDDDDPNDDFIANPEPEEKRHEVPDISKLPDKALEYNEEFSDDIISIGKPPTSESRPEKEIRDDLDGCIADNLSKQTEKLIKSPPNEIYKKAQMIEPLAQPRKGKSHQLFTEDTIMIQLQEINKFVTCTMLKLEAIELSLKRLDLSLESKPSMLPNLPLTELTQLKSLEDKLGDETIRKELFNLLRHTGGSKERDCVNRCLEKVFTDYLGQYCSWTGKKNNFKLSSLKLMTTLKLAVKQSFPNLTDESFERHVMSWFQHAYTRLKRHN